MNPTARFPAIALSMALSIILFALAGCNSAAPMAATPTGAAAGAAAASATPPATATAVATATLVPSPTPTLSPDALPAAVARLSADGDYAAVIAAVEPKLDALPAGSEATLRLALARAYGEEGRGEEAVTLLQALSTSDQTPEVQSEALVLLGATAETREDWTMAVDAYRRYLALDGAAAPYLHWRLAQDLVSAGDDAAALEELAAVDLATLSTSFQAEILEEQAAAQRRLADYDGALASYEAILAFARNTGYVALITQEAGQELLQAGRTEEATTRLAGVVSDYPDTYAAYLALRALDDLGAAEVTDLERGRILYAAGQYADAIAALEAYVAASDNPGAAALYYLALADKGAGLYDAALAAYDRLLADYGGDPLAPAAWMAKAGAVADQGGDASALYAEFAERYPDHARAPEALWRAADDLEGAGDWPRAAEFYHAVWNNYPADSRAAEALFREGLARYASGDAAGAGALWVYAQEQATGTGERARLALWLGLAAERGGNAAAAHARWHEAAALQPEGYYGLRAADLLAGAAPMVEEAYAPVALPEGTLSDAEWQELADWVAAWWPAASSAADPLDAALVAQVRALQRLGWVDAADTPWAALRDAAHDDPAALLALARLSSELERYNTTIYCAERLAALAQVAAPAGAEARATEAAPETELSETPGAAAEAPAASATPAALERLIYPTYYGHLIAAEAEARGMDPLLFLALVRQESRFEADAVSSAGATGLAQVMPATGEWIASMVGESGYRDELLTRPAVSVRYGVWYLDKMLEQTDGDWMAALVAYNAGPGNLSRWTGDAPIADHDLFYETIPLTEPQSYVRLIYPFYAHYRALYR